MAESVLRPTDLESLRAVIAEAVAGNRPLELCGSGSKRAFGRPLQVPQRLVLDGLSGIVAYDPDELVLTARAGTPMAEIEAACAAAGQALAFEPPDLAGLLENGKAAAGGTLGGMIACNLAGPRRFKAGAARDHALGILGVSGRGEVFKGGGKVVKNVTGYDLPKLLTGSYGTLAALAEITIKTLPAPETSATICLRGLDEAAAVRVLALALRSPHEVSGAAHLPPAAAARSPLEGAEAATLIRLEGFAPSVAHRAGELGDMLGGTAETLRLEEAESRALWLTVRDVAALLPAGGLVWRVSVAPMAGPRVLAAFRALRPEAEAVLDWGGGLVWIALPGDRADGGAAALRAAVASVGGGHATLIRAPAPLRAALPVFQPQPGPLAALTRRVKESFDPLRLLNPGRMYAEL